MRLYWVGRGEMQVGPFGGGPMPDLHRAGRVAPGRGRRLKGRDGLRTVAQLAGVRRDEPFNLLDRFERFLVPPCVGQLLTESPQLGFDPLPPGVGFGRQAARPDGHLCKPGSLAVGSPWLHRLAPCGCVVR